MTETGRPPGALLFFIPSGLMFALGTAITIYFCHSMGGGMDMPGGWTMSMMWMRMPGQTWFESGAMFLLMWLAMMVSMMLPSALPMLQRFRRAFAMEDTSGAAISTLLVACGYFTVWMIIGVVVYVAGVSWALATMQWSALSYAVPTLTGGSLVLAGAFQFSGWKMSGLGNCRNPIGCRMPQKCGGVQAALREGFRQGTCCAVCCSGLMLALLVLGAMNPFVMLAVAAVIASEKLLPKPEPIIQFTGAVMVVAGMAMVIRSIF